MGHSPNHSKSLEQLIAETKAHGEQADILSHLPSKDTESLALAKDIAMVAYANECKKGDTLEGRAFGLMQFAKVGLTTVAGVAGVMTIGNMSERSFKECLLFWLLVSSCYLFKLFYRGFKVVNVDAHFKPYATTFHRPDLLDVYVIKEEGAYENALEKHIVRMIYYLNKHVGENFERNYHYDCCFANTLGFLSVVLIFSGMIVFHQLIPELNFVLPGHQWTGAALLVFALSADILWAMQSGTWAERNRLKAMVAQK